MGDGYEWGIGLTYLIDDEFVIVDDIGGTIDADKTQKNWDWRSEVLYEIIDYRYNSLLPTIFTSNFTKDQLYQIYSKRTLSRLFASENVIVEDRLSEDKRKQGK